MTIVHPPRTDSDADTIEALDWAPPCGYSLHRHVGGGLATLAVWFTASACGHYPMPFLFFCDSCWAFRGHAGRTHCITCGLGEPAFGPILRVERI